MAFGLPKVGEMTAMLDERFNKLLLELQAIRNVLMQILAAVQKEDTK